MFLVRYHRKKVVIMSESGHYREPSLCNKLLALKVVCGGTTWRFVAGRNRDLTIELRFYEFAAICTSYR